MGKDRKKIYVLCDTVSMLDEESHLAFGEHDIQIPYITMNVVSRCMLDDNYKSDHAYEVQKKWHKYSKKMKKGGSWVSLGEDKGSIYFGDFKAQLTEKSSMLFNERTDAHELIDAALCTQIAFPQKEVVIVSNNISLRIKAKAIGVDAEEYRSGNINNEELERSSIFEICIEDHSWVNNLMSCGTYPCSLPMEEARPYLTSKQQEPNTFFIVKHKNNKNKKSIILYYDPVKEEIVDITGERKTAVGIAPINDRQVCLAYVLRMDHIQFIVATGTSGTGKTLLATAASLDQEYENVMLIKPIVGMTEEESGFLPGGLNAKLAPWMASYHDNFKVIQGANPKDSKLRKMIQKIGKDKDEETEESNNQKGEIGYGSLEHLRGRSLNNTFLVSDEMQNVFPSTMKGAMTRIGNNSKFVTCGDLFQIDNKKLTKKTNGLAHFASRMRGARMFVHIHLTECERSDAAKEAARRL